MKVRTVNAVELRQQDALNWIEFETVICHDEWEQYGFGASGQKVTFAGVLMEVTNGQTAGRAWSRVRVQVTAPATGQRVEIESVLGAHRTVTLTELDAPEPPGDSPQQCDAAAEPASQEPELMAKVREALHRGQVPAHDPATGREGWQLRDAMADGSGAVYLTWHGVQPPSHAATERDRELTVGAVTMSALARMELYLRAEFTIHRVHVAADPRAGIAPTGLLIFDPDGAPDETEF
ncbi:hypothetical protein [Streptomyces sp. NPDC002851]